MAGRRDAHRRQAPLVLHVRIEIDAIGLERHLRDEAGDRHLVVGFLPQRLLVARAPAWRVRRQPVEAHAERRLVAARGQASAAVEAALRIGRHEVDDAGAGDHALVLVQRMLEEPARAGAVAEHQILADDAVRVRQAVGKFRPTSRAAAGAAIRCRSPTARRPWRAAVSPASGRRSRRRRSRGPLLSTEISRT